MATVLIVEDEFAIADLLEMVLTDEGYHVLTAANGRQGLERLAEGPRPDLVISDYMMPVLDGAGLLRAMRESEAQRDIPCIVMSSMPEANVRERTDGYAALSASRSTSTPWSNWLRPSSRHPGRSHEARPARCGRPPGVRQDQHPCARPDRSPPAPISPCSGQRERLTSIGCGQCDDGQPARRQNGRLGRQ